MREEWELCSRRCRQGVFCARLEKISFFVNFLPYVCFIFCCCFGFGFTCILFSSLGFCSSSRISFSVIVLLLLLLLFCVCVVVVVLFVCLFVCDRSALNGAGWLYS